MKKFSALIFIYSIILVSLYSAKIKVTVSIKYSTYNLLEAEYYSIIISDDFIPMEENDEVDTISIGVDEKYENAYFDPIEAFSLFSVLKDEQLILETIHIEGKKPLTAHYSFSLLNNGEITYDFQNWVRIMMTGIPDLVLSAVNKYIDQFEG